MELASQGRNQNDIAKLLQINHSTISRDLSILRREAKQNIKKYIDERLPEEYEKCMVGLNSILTEAWNTSYSITMNNNITKIGLNKPFNIQAITLQKGLPIADKLDKSTEEHGMNFVLEHGAFAQCFPHGDAKAGQNTTIDVSGLKPNSKIHGTLGSAPGFDGQTNSTGGGTIHFSIAINTKDGLHLITVGVDKTAVTANCVLNLKQQ
jgi:hypothetical protein